MAASDYRLCDICGRKTFYDAELNYEKPSEAAPHGLWNLGDWSVLCLECSKTKKCAVVDK